MKAKLLGAMRIRAASNAVTLVVSDILIDKQERKNEEKRRKAEERALEEQRLKEEALRQEEEARRAREEQRRYFSLL
jgi:mannitol-specific phosphotransferase system IIBC component